ncbi:sensor domain-containing phosphodiesterase [Saccharibacillus sp. CPCC 101409]|uniref:putative bifunctional diguanylate cyclase/phosphodiesterase n=1 Tax=Saccharibacillus sp. CPCC 101409 TaxID=3058041 RepID=UPI002671F28E|nr:sensor domain-containing phosphodiesterase [Saccharibacillus sp. CPCC 101409]MDO3413036.1 sensor domain-containing phosphodiesterase [Saccharibacillus sp. CPCC 101409]
MKPMKEQREELIRAMSKTLFSLLHSVIDANTFFMAHNNGRTNTIVSAWNAGETLIEEGAVLPYHITYCRLVGDVEGPIIIEDTTLSSLTRDLPVTADIGKASFVGVPIRLQGGELYGTICGLDRERVFTGEDIEQLEQTASVISGLLDLEQSTHYDDLTGFLRHSALESFCQRDLEDSPKSVIFMDLDNFKEVNDRYGHAMGDRVLQSLARAIRRAADDDWLLCRYGGDEFVVVLPTDSEALVQQAVERLVEAFQKEELPLTDPEESLTLSIGACLQADSLRQYIERADTAMYRIKKDGKDGIGIFQIEDQQQELDVREALRKNEFELYFQPIVGAESGAADSYEALLRWRHPLRGMIPPIEAIEMAEAAGLIEQVDLWVLREACLAAGLIRPAGRIHVNITAKSLRDPHFADYAAEIFMETNCPPSKIEIELNETLQRCESRHIVQQVDQLRQWGVTFSLDDLGSQQSAGIGLLRDLAVSTLKLDGALCRGARTDRIGRALIRGVVEMGRELGMSVVAEGIENEEQRRLLVSLGCDLLQGYYFFRPMPLAELLRSEELRRRMLSC